MIAQAEDVTGRPVEGELTGTQGRGEMASSFGLQMQGFAPVSARTYATYRSMRNNETVGMARIASFAPVKASPWSVELDDDHDGNKDVEDDGTDPRVRLVEKTILPMRAHLLHHLRFAKDYGWQSFEKVWEPRTVDGATRWVYRKVKPLLPDRTSIVVDKETGSFMGLKQDDTTIPPEKSFVFTVDPEGGDMYGRSVYENIRQTSWRGWTDTMEKLGRMMTKIAGIIMMVEYPEGKSKDASGQTIDNYDIACAVVREVAKGHAIAMPNTLARHARTLAEKGIDVSKLKAWNFNFLETSSGHLAEMLQILTHFERLMVRGLLISERSVIEATMAGSRADSETAADLSLVIAEDLQDDIINAINKYLVNPLLVYNFGPDAADTVVVRAEKLQDESKAMLRSVMAAYLNNPNNADVVAQLLDIDKGIDTLGLPRKGNIEDAANLADDSPEEKQRLREMADALQRANAEGEDDAEPEDPAVAG